MGSIKSDSGLLLILGGIFAIPLIMIFGIAILFGALLNITEKEEEQSFLGIGYVCIEQSEFNESMFEQGFIGKGVLEGKGKLYIEYANKYNLDPVLLASISFHETANGTSNAIREKNNTGGLMNPDGSGLYTFSSIEQSLDVQARSISNRIKEIIANKGEYKLEYLRDVYAPLGATNDPNNLNQHWLPRIIEYATALGGFTMNCEADMEGGANVSVDGASLPVDIPLQFNSPYGKRYHPIDKVWHLHAGTDIECDYGDKIYSVFDGVVINSKYNSGWGWYVAVLHDDGSTTLYAHMEKKGIAVGKTVKAGEQVGMCGTTGNSTGTHLHLEYRVGDNATNIGTTSNTIDIRPILLKIQQKIKD